MRLGSRVAVAVVYLAAAALIQPLAWEPPHAAGVALKKKKICVISFLLSIYTTTPVSV